MFQPQKFLFLLPPKIIFYLSMLRNAARTLSMVQSSHLNSTPLIGLFFHLFFKKKKNTNLPRHQRHSLQPEK